MRHDLDADAGADTAAAKEGVLSWGELGTSACMPATGTRAARSAPRSSLNTPQSHRMHDACLDISALHGNHGRRRRKRDRSHAAAPSQPVPVQQQTALRDNGGCVSEDRALDLGTHNGHLASLDGGPAASADACRLWGRIGCNRVADLEPLFRPLAPLLAQACLCLCTRHVCRSS